MTQQCYYIGIDMDDRNAVISYYKAGMREPETLSTIAGSEIYQIPVALIKKRGIGQWFIGEEAKKMALIQNEDVIGHLLDNALAKKQVTVENIVYEAEELFVALYQETASFSEPSGKSGTAGLPGDHSGSPVKRTDGAVRKGGRRSRIRTQSIDFTGQKRKFLLFCIQPEAGVMAA